MCSVYIVHVYGHGKSQSSFPGGAGANHDKLKEMLMCMCDGFMAIDHYPQERCACCAWEMQTEGIPGCVLFLMLPGVGESQKVLVN